VDGGRLKTGERRAFIVRRNPPNTIVYVNLSVVEKKR